MRYTIKDLFSDELTEHEKQWMKELSEQAIKEKWCTSCIYYYDDGKYRPSWVDYRGSCKWGYASCCDYTDDCDKYELNYDKIEKYKKECKEYGLKPDKETLLCSYKEQMKGALDEEGI